MEEESNFASDNVILLLLQPVGRTAPEILPKVLSVTKIPVSHLNHCLYINLPLRSGLGPVDGRWSKWSDWSLCNVQTGTTRRERNCTEPSPAHGGRDCQGEDSEMKECVAGTLIGIQNN